MNLQQLSSDDMDRIGRVGLTVLDWAKERLANSERIAKTKHGSDRELWHEDEAYWRAIVIALSRLPAIGATRQSQPEQPSPSVQEELPTCVVLARERLSLFVNNDVPISTRDLREMLSAVVTSYEALFALQQPRASSGEGWQPIESAPKDGTLIDLWADHGRVPDCTWGSLDWEIQLLGWPKDSVGWREWSPRDDAWSRVENVTYWRLPPAPPVHEDTQVKDGQ